MLAYSIARVALEQGSGRMVLFFVDQWEPDREKTPGYVAILTESFCDMDIPIN